MFTIRIASSLPCDSVIDSQSSLSVSADQELAHFRCSTGMFRRRRVRGTLKNEAPVKFIFIFVFAIVLFNCIAAVLYALGIIPELPSSSSTSKVSSDASAIESYATGPFYRNAYIRSRGKRPNSQNSKYSLGSTIFNCQAESPVSVLRQTLGTTQARRE